MIVNSVDFVLSLGENSNEIIVEFQYFEATYIKTKNI